MSSIEDIIKRYVHKRGYLFCTLHRDVLGSGLIDHIQKMTMAAIAMADMKVCAQRS